MFFYKKRKKKKNYYKFGWLPSLTAIAQLTLRAQTKDCL
jgi:hypothetical protein